MSKSRYTNDTRLQIKYLLTENDELRRRNVFTPENRSINNLDLFDRNGYYQQSE